MTVSMFLPTPVTTIKTVGRFEKQPLSKTHSYLLSHISEDQRYLRVRARGSAVENPPHPEAYLHWCSTVNFTHRS